MNSTLTDPSNTSTQQKPTNRASADGTSQQAFLLPPHIHCVHGETGEEGEKIRHVGFEFEYAGLGLDQAADLIATTVGGEKRINNRFCYEVAGSKYGTFSIESDASLLKNRKYEKYFELLGLSSSATLADRVEEFIAGLTEDFVPYEIVTPPIPIDELDVIEELRVKLHRAGAQGTNAHFYSAYGMQFNPELPCYDTETLLAYMRAYFLSEGRLLQEEEIPLMRRLLPYIDPFPEAYTALVLDSSYKPDRETFMRDYLRFNPTRNRPIDWLPLFAWLDRDLTFEYDVEKDLIKPRPTLHYRLPSCLIDDPTWSVAAAWNRWVEVERRAVEELVKIREFIRGSTNEST